MPIKPERQWIVETAGIAALLLLVAAVYARTAAYPFISYDDGPMILNHPVVKQGLSWQGLSWSLTHGLHGIWMPVTAFTHMTDMTLFGPWAGGHHLTSVLWHALAVLAFYAALRTLTGARGASLLAAALFAAHPLRVEAVAWVSSRKDLVCGTFFALALLAHGRYARRPSPARYALVFAAVLLALAGKTSAAPVPAVLLLLDAWPLDRFRDAGTGGFSPRRALWLLAEKVPFGLLAVAVMAVTWRAQHALGAVVETGAAGAAPPALRAAAVGGYYMHYLAAFLWPSGLAPHYPHAPLVPWKAAAAWAAVLALSLGAVTLRRTLPWLAVGWFWFLVTLIPVVGLLPYGNTPYADRYTYLPGMGLSLAAAWLLCGVGGRLAKCRIGAPACRSLAVRKEPTAEGGCPTNRAGRCFGIALAVALVLFLAGLSWRQSACWRDTFTAFSRVARLYPNDDLAQAKVGDELYAQGDLDGAVQRYLEAIRIRPDSPDWNYNLGSMLVESDPGRAGPFLETAASLAPERGDIRTNIGYALLQLKKPVLALPHVEAGARLDSTNPNAHINLGVALMELGRKEEARAAFQRALSLDPANAAAQANLRLLKQ